MTNLEKNRLLAEYLGAKQNANGEYEMYGFIEDITDSPTEQHFFKPEDMRFHCSYDWLMDIVHRIEGEGYIVDITLRAVSIHEIGRMIVDIGGHDNKLTKFQALFKACVEFVLWYNNMYSPKLDMTKDQNLMSIRRNSEAIGYIELKDGKIITTGLIGENTYDNFVELIKGLWGMDIHIDDFYS